MSCQPPPWTRRNVSPKQQLRPVRATVPVSLMRQQNQGSPTKNVDQINEGPPDLALHSLDLDEITVSNESVPTIFLGPRGEKSKTLNLRSQPQQHHIRRTSSLDALFLDCQWKPEAIFLGHFMVDKATQTPDEWFETDLKAAQWKTMVTTGEHLEVKYIRQKLHRSNQNSRASGALFCSQRQSPIQGDHSAISGSASAYHTGAFGVMHKASHTSSVLRPQPRKSPRLQSSLEGLNQEIETIVLRDSSEFDKEYSKRVYEPAPEGHRAPIAELFHSIKNLPGRESSTSSDTASRSHSISPSIPVIPTSPEDSTSPSTDDGLSKLGSSPHINEFLSREPPDGCEKVTISEDFQRHSVLDFSFGNPRPQVYVLLPSQSSAFCPLYKDLNPPTTLLDSYNVVPATQTSPQCHK